MYTTAQTDAIAVVNRILNFTQRHAAPPADWYVGITDEPDRRIFVDHRVKAQHDPHTYLPVPSKEAAQLIEDFLTDPIFGGFDGGPGGDTNGRFVYAYLKKPHTKQ